MAVPSITATPLVYNAADGGIKWEIRITQNDALYDDALAVELPLQLSNFALYPSFTTFLKDSAGDATNGAAGQTWYYNETAAGSGVGLWNTSDPFNAADTAQNVGFNPFTSTEMEGLTIDTVNKRLFAALGSTVNRTPLDADGATAGTQVNVLHVTTSDGLLSWTNAIVGENGVQYSGISGSRGSVIKGDMNGSGGRNFGDLGPFGTALTNPALYATMFPGLDRVARGDMNTTGTMGTLNFGDLGPFGACLTNPVSCIANPTSGSGAGGEAGGASLSGSTVPEPTAMILFLMAGLGSLVIRRNR